MNTEMQTGTIQRLREAVERYDYYDTVAAAFPTEMLTEAADEIERLQYERDELLATLRALSGLAATFPRPSGQPELCRLLLDIEGISRAAIAKAEGK